MKKIQLFRTIAILIVIFNILNYFIMASAYTGFNVKESATLFDYTFINFTNIEGRYHVIGSASDNAFLPVILLLFVDLYLAYVLILCVPKYGDYMNMPYKRIYFPCFIGTMLHLLLFVFSVPSSSHDESYFMMIGRGMLLNPLYIIGYLVILWMFYRIKRKELTCNCSIKTKLNVYDVVVLGILIELVLSFFYVSLVNRLVIRGIDRDGLKYSAYYGNLFFSQLMMIFKEKNYYNLSGNVEGYPYMIIPLIILIAQILLAIFKPKGKIIMIGCLSLVSVVVMTIGLCDMCDSVYTNYISANSRNFFDLVGIGFYYIIILNIFIILIYLMSIKYYDYIIVGAHEIEDIVNMDRIKKDEEENKKNIEKIDENNKENEELLEKESD